MIKETIDKIREQVESLGQSIERIELSDDGCSVFIRIKKSDYIGEEYDLCGEESTILNSLLAIKHNCYEELKNEIEKVEDSWKDWDNTCKDTDNYLKSQGWF